MCLRVDGELQPLPEEGMQSWLETVYREWQEASAQSERRVQLAAVLRRWGME